MYAASPYAESRVLGRFDATCLTQGPRNPTHVDVCFNVDIPGNVCVRNTEGHGDDDDDEDKDDDDDDNDDDDD